MIDFKEQKLLVIAPHPDDEVIGCGGLISRIKEEGGKVFVLFLTVGDTLDFTKKGFSSLTERKKEIEKVASHLQFDGYHIAFEGNDTHLKLDLIGQKEIMSVIEKDSPVSLAKIGPTILAFPYGFSYNQDHRAAALAAHGSLRPHNSSSGRVQLVMSYEEVADHWSLRSFEPNLYVPLNKKQIDQKLAAMDLYYSQTRPFPSTRSTKTLETLAAFRGSLCNGEFAEAFHTYRSIL